MLIVLALATTLTLTELKPLNEQHDSSCMQILLNADQADRSSNITASELTIKDGQRLSLAMTCLSSSPANTAYDLYVAAVLHHHNEGALNSHYALAFIRAAYAIEKNRMYGSFAATVYDRLRTREGRNQVYGTQFDCSTGHPVQQEVQVDTNNNPLAIDELALNDVRTSIEMTRQIRC